MGRLLRKRNGDTTPKEIASLPFILKHKYLFVFLVTAILFFITPVLFNAYFGNNFVFLLNPDNLIIYLCFTVPISLVVGFFALIGVVFGEGSIKLINKNTDINNIHIKSKVGGLIIGGLVGFVSIVIVYTCMYLYW